MYCQMSSSVQLESGNTRMCSPGCDAAVVQVPQLGPLVLRDPTGRTRRGTRRRAPWRGPSPRRGAPRRTRRRTDAARWRRAAPGLRAGCAEPSGSSGSTTAALDRVLHRRDDQLHAQLVDAMVAEVEHLGKLWPVSTCSSGNGTRPARTPSRQVQHHERVLAAGEQQRRSLELGGHLADDVDRFGFE